MNKKKWIITGVIFLGVGVLICTIMLVTLGFDFKKLSKVTYVTNTYDVKENFKNITIKGDTEKISFVLSEDDECKVVCREDENNLHEVKVDGDTLIVKSKNKKHWHFNIGIAMESPEITIYLPKEEYKLLKIESDTGDVNIPKDFKFSDISIKLDTGDVISDASVEGEINIMTDTGSISVTDTSAERLKLDTDTGRISMINVIASGEFNLSSDTGNVKFDSCDADTIYVKTDTGNVSGSLLSDKIFTADSDTGSVDVPKTNDGGKCEIKTDTGNIKIQIED